MGSADSPTPGARSAAPPCPGPALTTVGWLRLLWWTYTLLIVYGSLYPMTEWDGSQGGLQALLDAGVPEPPPLRDVVINVLVYIPFGLFCTLLIPGRPLIRLLLATLAGLTLSSSMELAQTWLPVRITSLADIALNTTGTLIGFVIAVLIAGPAPYRRRPHPSPWLHLIARLQGYRLPCLLTAALMISLYGAVALQKTPDDTSLKRINPVVFSNHVNSPAGMLELLMVVALVALLAVCSAPFIRNWGRLWAISTALFVLAMGVELGKTTIPGTTPDITLPIVALVTWLLTALSPLAHPRLPLYTAKEDRVRHHHRKTTLAFAGIAIALATGLLLWVGSMTDPLYRPKPYQLPPVAVLPSPTFPAFRENHPRLPAPSREDIAALDRDNPEFWSNHQIKATRGELYSRILLAYTGRGEMDRDRLLADLLALEPTGRGHRQTEPLALALDWLHDQWTADERAQLIEKTHAACQYQAYLIRDHYRLSPYNAILYNRPLHALMAATLVTHGHAQDDRCMRFTADYWRHRVIPVWRQVMGEGGGWHEGAEYLAVGLGQAAYQLPAMWRHATGEDLFRAVPGLAGLPDFAVHRRRPDGLQSRMGSGNHLDRTMPDLGALSLEFGHAHGYRLAAPPASPEPLAYPWGPLSTPEAELDDPLPELPTHAHFDGIGLLTARSDWGENASYVTFKAGNNYWSHSHLDQGTFTVFKEGALVINSGLSGPSGQSDHVVNYTRQSIAHNVVTVTDPDDTVPMPQRDPGLAPRAVANDGGQRRVGSGWGLPAPMDHLEWRRLEHIYRTVGDTRHGATEDVVWKVADLTPAYTNIDSGKGDFAARTRRVERYLRTFVYDARNEIIVIHDRVASSDPAFRTRWLLHSINEPALAERGFHIRATDPSSDRPGGHLEGRVLLPADPVLTTVGGPGFEFYVDGRNYDEQGMVQRIAAGLPHGEIGAWRLEISPEADSAETEFLVVMGLSGSGQQRPIPDLMLDSGPERTLRIGGEHPRVFELPDDIDPVRVQRQP